MRKKVKSIVLLLEVLLYLVLFIFVVFFKTFNIFILLFFSFVIVLSFTLLTKTSHIVKIFGICHALSYLAMLFSFSDERIDVPAIIAGVILFIPVIVTHPSLYIIEAVRQKKAEQWRAEHPMGGTL